MPRLTLSVKCCAACRCRRRLSPSVASCLACNASPPIPRKNSGASERCSSDIRLILSSTWISLSSSNAKSKTAAISRGRLSTTKLGSVQPESHFHVDLHSDGLAVFHGRLKLPGFHSFHGLLVQSQTKRASYANVARATIRANHQPQNASPLILRLPRFLRVFRIRRVNRLRRGHAATHFKRSAANSATMAWTNSRSFTRTHTTAVA